jgi:hypothetical protein
MMRASIDERIIEKETEEGKCCVECRYRNRKDVYVHRGRSDRSQNIFINNTTLHFTLLHCTYRKMVHVQTYLRTSAVRSSQTVHLFPLTLHRPPIEGMDNRDIQISWIINVRGALYFRIYFLTHTHGEGLCDVEHRLLPMSVLRVWGGGENNRLVYLK